MSSASTLDRFIAWVSPAAGVRREVARAYLEMARRHRRYMGTRRYDGASRGRRTQGWLTVGSSANAETLAALKTLRDRSRDSVRNSEWMSCAVDVVTTNVVGRGIKPKARHESDAVARRADEIFEQWADTTEPDPERQDNFGAQQALACRSMVEGGETLARFRTRREQDGLTIPLQLQLLEGDHLDSEKDETLTARLTASTGGRVVQGVEFDAIGRRTAYHLFRNHPGEIGQVGNLDSVPVPAAQVLHLYRKLRVGQVRGVPWTAVALMRLHDLDAYEDSEAVRNVVASAYAGFVRDIAPGVEFQQGTGPIALAGQAKNDKEQPIDEIEPGTMEFLPPGKQVDFNSPPQNETYPRFVATQLRAIAKGIGITYESLTGDLSSVSFTSGRMGWLEMARNVSVWQAHLMVTRFCVPVWQRAMALAVLEGQLPGTGGVLPTATWTPPRREMIDPKNEIAALVMAIRAGFMSVSEGVRMFGFQPRQVLAELAGDLEAARELDLVLSTDGAVNPTTGQTSRAQGEQVRRLEDLERRLRGMEDRVPEWTEEDARDWDPRRPARNGSGAGAGNGGS